MGISTQSIHTCRDIPFNKFKKKELSSNQENDFAHRQNAVHRLHQLQNTDCKTRK